jgi:hypothetical protein
MKQNIARILPIMIVVVLLAVLPTLLQAQPPDDPGGDPAPIDGGASIVIAACAGYLAKRKQIKK